MADRSAAHMVGTILVVMAKKYTEAMEREDLISADLLHLLAIDIFLEPDIRDKDFSWDQMGNEAEEACKTLRVVKERLISEVEPVPAGSLPWYDEGDMMLVYPGEPGWD